jgi:hypothetical protein
MAELECCSKCLGKAACTDPEHCRAVATELAEMSDSAPPECPGPEESKKCFQFIVAFGDSCEYAKGATEEEAKDALIARMRKKLGTTELEWWIVETTDVTDDEDFEDIADDQDFEE